MVYNCHCVGDFPHCGKDLWPGTYARWKVPGLLCFCILYLNRATCGLQSNAKCHVPLF